METLWILAFLVTVLGVILELKYRLVTMAIETMLHMAEGYNEQYRVDEDREETAAFDGDDRSGKKSS
jgi:hypothetical protein